MSNTTNKVEFGINELYFGLYTVGDGGTVTMGGPVRVPGAVGYSPEESSKKNTFYADNGPYWSGYSGGEHEGDVEVALFPDSFKETFLGYVRTADGGLANVKNAVKPSVYMMFSVEGDAQKRKAIYYNGTLGAIKREYHTIEENKEPVTETLNTTFLGDATTGITMASYVPGDTGYDTLFTNPPVPALANQGE